MTELSSIMFHDLHLDEKNKTQGSVDSEEFRKIIDHIRAIHEIENATNIKSLNNQQIINKIFFTFDDGLKSQFQIGNQLLNENDIRACFFIHTAPLSGEYDVHQILRIFRNSSRFKSVEGFNIEFLDFLYKNLDEEKIVKLETSFINSQYLEQFTFYSENDRKLRYVRDFYFDHNDYKNLSLDFIKSYEVNVKSLVETTYMDESSILKLHNMGHYIGLHSHSHASNLKTLEYEKQRFEIQKNIDVLTDIIDEKPLAMSYPSNSYNEETIDILKIKGIKFGFRADTLVNKSPYELSRIDARILLDSLG